jgi:hypothetical protein
MKSILHSRKVEGCSNWVKRVECDTCIYSDLTSVERLIYFLSKLDRRITITVSSDEDELPREEIVIAAGREATSEARVR